MGTVALINIGTLATGALERPLADAEAILVKAGTFLWSCPRCERL